MFEEECLETHLLRVFVHDSATEVFLGCGSKDAPQYLHFQTAVGFWEQVDAAASGRRFNRPQTFELLADFITAYEVKIVSIYIHAYVNKTYIAQICLAKPASGSETFPRVVTLDARPSDALLLAATFRKKVFVKKTLFTDSDANGVLLKQFEARQKKPAQNLPLGKE